jgi:hypothetical protein
LLSKEENVDLSTVLTTGGSIIVGWGLKLISDKLQSRQQKKASNQALKREKLEELVGLLLELESGVLHDENMLMRAIQTSQEPEVAKEKLPYDKIRLLVRFYHRELDESLEKLLTERGKLGTFVLTIQPLAFRNPDRARAATMELLDITGAIYSAIHEMFDQASKLVSETLK